MNDKKQEVLALIPARGGSKGIPRKNLLMVAGKPLISYSIQQALASNLVTRTIVSTDDKDIADIACKYGAEVPFMRPSEFASDFSPDIDVFRHALLWLREKEGYECDCVVHLRPTGPVRRVQLIDKAIQLLLDNPHADSVRAVSKAMQTPYKMWHMENGLLKPLLSVAGMKESYCQPRQLLPQVYWQNGYVDIVRSGIIIDKGEMCGDRILPFLVNEPIYELDYLESIPALEKALKELENGTTTFVEDKGERYSV